MRLYLVFSSCQHADRIINSGYLSMRAYLCAPSSAYENKRCEIFDTIDDAWTRLQNYAFSQGFAIVTGLCVKADTRRTYKCIHHSDSTAYWRKLSKHREEEDLEYRTTRRQEMTKIKVKGCGWLEIISFRDLQRGGINRTRPRKSGTHARDGSQSSRLRES